MLLPASHSVLPGFAVLLATLCLAGPLLIGADAPKWDKGAPWTAPAGTVFEYKKHFNDLKSLLELQRTASGSDKAQTHWISVMHILDENNDQNRRMLLNAYYSLVRYGQQSNIIVPLFMTNKDMQWCIDANLPCYNATKHWDNKKNNNDHFGNRELWWSRHYVVLEILKNGVNVQLVECQTVFFRPIVPALHNAILTTSADAYFDREEHSPEVDGKGFGWVVNTDTYALVADARSVTLVQVWLKRHQGNDKEWLGWLQEMAYMLCDNAATCRSVRRKGPAALFRLPLMFRKSKDSPAGTNCIAKESLWDKDEWCNNNRLYVRWICGEGFGSAKEAWDHHKLWLIDEKSQPMYPEGTDKRHEHLPCEGLAWADRLGRVE